MRQHPPIPSSMPTYGSVCSGVEAVSLAWRPLGLEPAWFAEIDPFACAVLAHRHPNVTNLGDMTRLAAQVRSGAAAAPDILVGGTPCQTFSIAGRRAGLSDPRGQLTLCYVELAHAIDQARRQIGRPQATHVWENVPGVLSDRSNAFGHFLGALSGERRALKPSGPKWTHAGSVSGPRRRIAWRVLDAQYFGVAQRRRRVLLVASGRDDLDPAEVLFESEGLHRHPAAGYAPWREPADLAASSAQEPSRIDAWMNAAGQVTWSFGGGNTRGPIDLAACLTTKARGDFKAETFTVHSVSAPSVTFDAVHHGYPIAPAAHYAFAQNSRGELRLESSHGQVAGALSTRGGKPGQGASMIASVALRGRAHGMAAELEPNVSPTLRACSGGGDKGHVVAPIYDAHFQCALEPSEHGDWAQWRVRRLMPVECERLQGMPDHYTLVPYRGKLAADAPRYKAIGNSMAVPCIAWLGQRLRSALHRTRAQAGR